MARATTLGLTCAICERSLLLGERTVRFTPDGRDYVDVCPLCQEIALEHGWIREGTPSLPAFQHERRRHGFLSALLRPRRPVEAVASDPAHRRLSTADQAVVEAAYLFNDSAYRRTVEGIARSLGQPDVSVVALSGVNREVVITFAWDISWYQYRIAFDSSQPVRLAERGHDPTELEPAFTEWNAEFTDEFLVVASSSAVVTLCTARIDSRRGRRRDGGVKELPRWRVGPRRWRRDVRER